MNFLIVDDDIISRHVLTALMREYGNTDEAVNGVEAVKAFRASKRANNEYTAIFMDIMMPELDGKTATSNIREIEKKHGIQSKDEAIIIMLSSLDDPKNVMESYYDAGATSYIVKPVTAEKINTEFKKLGLI